MHELLSIKSYNNICIYQETQLVYPPYKSDKTFTIDN